jgi:hypothetical protein
MFFEIRGQPLDLFALIFRGNHRQYRLVESAADHFHLFAFYKRSQQLEIFRMMLLYPRKQRPGKVQGRANSRVLFKVLDKWKIRVLVAALENVFEISGGLVCVDQER